MGRSRKQRPPLPPIWTASDDLWGLAETILADLDPSRRAAGSGLTTASRSCRHRLLHASALTAAFAAGTHHPRHAVRPQGTLAAERDIRCALSSSSRSSCSLVRYRSPAAVQPPRRHNPTGTTTGCHPGCHSDGSGLAHAAGDRDPAHLRPAAGSSRLPGCPRVRRPARSTSLAVMAPGWRPSGPGRQTGHRPCIWSGHRTAGTWPSLAMMPATRVRGCTCLTPTRAALPVCSKSACYGTRRSGRLTGASCISRRRSSLGDGGIWVVPADGSAAPALTDRLNTGDGKTD